MDSRRKSSSVRNAREIEGDPLRRPSMSRRPSTKVMHRLSVISCASRRGSHASSVAGPLDGVSFAVDVHAVEVSAQGGSYGDDLDEGSPGEECGASDSARVAAAAVAAVRVEDMVPARLWRAHDGAIAWVAARGAHIAQRHVRRAIAQLPGAGPRAACRCHRVRRRAHSTVDVRGFVRRRAECVQRRRGAAPPLDVPCGRDGVPVSARARFALRCAYTLRARGQYTEPRDRAARRCGAAARRRSLGTRHGGTPRGVRRRATEALT